jgi:hypothetical protein
MARRRAQPLSKPRRLASAHDAAIHEATDN